MTQPSSSPHRFKTGDIVTMRVHQRGAPRAHGVFRIVKAMPAGDDGLQYRIRDEKDWREHMAQEGQLSLARVEGIQ